LFSLARVHPLTSIAWYVVCVATVYHPNLFFPVLQLTVVKHIVKQYLIRETAQAQACMPHPKGRQEGRRIVAHMSWM
jgi:hypothetical protein